MLVHSFAREIHQHGCGLSRVKRIFGGDRVALAQRKVYPLGVILCAIVALAKCKFSVGMASQHPVIHRVMLVLGVVKMFEYMMVSQRPNMPCIRVS